MIQASKSPICFFPLIFIVEVNSVNQTNHDCPVHREVIELLTNKTIKHEN